MEATNRTTPDSRPRAGSLPGFRPGSTEEADELLRRLGRLQDERRPFDAIWEEVAEYMGPTYLGFTAEPQHPRKPRPDIVDSTARRAAKVFSAGMLSGASSPSQRWFSLALEDPEAADRPEAKAWLQELERLFTDDLLRRGFYPQQHLAYHQAGLFGWQCLYLDESPAHGIRFSARPLREIYIAENHQGVVDTVFREFTLTARQALQKWGREALPDPVRRCLDTPRGQDDRRFTFLHAVFPREERNLRSLDRTGMGFASVYLERESRRVVAEGGYREMPYIVTRSYRLPGTPYSYSPGTEALADVKMLNEMKRLILEAGQLSVAPPYLVPDDGFVGRVSFEPRSLNYYRADGRGPHDFAPLNVGGDPRFAWELIETTRKDVNEAFFVDLFLAIKQRAEMGASPTAMEVSELAGERMFLLGPMLMQQQQENFTALFERLFSLKLRRGELPPVPEALRGERFKAEYVSPLALAQRESRTRSILASYGDAARIAAADPGVMDIFDHEQNVRAIMEGRGMPHAGIRSRRQAARAREERARAQAQAMQARSLGELAGKLPALGKAPDPGSPAAALLASLGLAGGLPGPAPTPAGRKD
ncbi:MAG: portal protein [Thermodesulfobacteriota bacterium]